MPVAQYYRCVAQIKIYGLREHLEPVKQRLSDAIHSCVVDALRFPPEKRYALGLIAQARKLLKQPSWK